MEIVKRLIGSTKLKSITNDYTGKLLFIQLQNKEIFRIIMNGNKRMMGFLLGIKVDLKTLRKEKRH